MAEGTEERVESLHTMRCGLPRESVLQGEELRPVQGGAEDTWTCCVLRTEMCEKCEVTSRRKDTTSNAPASVEWCGQGHVRGTLVPRVLSMLGPCCA